MHETSIRFYDENAIIQTSGGELSGTLDDYGIGIGDFCFYGLTGKQMEQLCCLIHDHLYLNGHRFEIIETGEQDQKQRLRVKEWIRNDFFFSSKNF